MEILLYNSLFPLYGKMISNDPPVKEYIKLRDDAKANFFYFHGNNGTVKEMFPLFDDIFDHYPVNLIAIEYPGYWSESKAPPPFNLQNFINYMNIEIQNVLESLPNLPLVFYGRSIGASIASQVAMTLENNYSVSDDQVNKIYQKVDYLILATPLSHVGNEMFTGTHNPLLWMASFVLTSFPDVLDTREVVRTLECPIMVIYAKDDKLIPFSNTKRLKEANPDISLVQVSGGHNDFGECSENLKEILYLFLNF